MNVGGAIGWVEAHPWESAAIGGGSVLILLWVLGVFGHSSSAASAGASNLASAYYAAEAQQAVVGGQIQQATIAGATQTAIAGMQTNAAVQVNAANATAAATINGQNTGAAMTINAAQVKGATQQARIAGQVALGQSSDQLQATWSNNAAVLAETQSNNDTAAAIATSHDNAASFQDALGSIIPQELAMSGGFGNFYLPGGLFSVNTGAPTSPTTLESLGYSAAGAAKLAGVPYPGGVQQ
jgi:hypothetical protein